MSDKQTKVGMGVMVLNDKGEVLLQKRKGAHAEGQYALPGGHLEYMESFADCAKREVREECGMEIDDVQLLCLANEKENVPKHYINICVRAHWKSGEPHIMEPERTESLGWYSLDDLPSPLFASTARAITSYKTGQIFFDA